MRAGPGPGKIFKTRAGPAGRVGSNEFLIL